MLAEAGYAQYEVSAYARPGRQCAHNLNYWRFGDYLGIGAGAHRDIEQRGHVHVGIGRGIARQRISFIRYLGMQGTGIRFGVNGDGLNA